MIAHYGYKDAEGEFYITIDTSQCVGCEGKPCIKACPGSVFVEEEDPYGDEVVGVDDFKRRKIVSECAPCKPDKDRPPLPCIVACPYDALSHSW